MSRYQLIRAGLTGLLCDDPERVSVVDVTNKTLGDLDAVIYDLAGLVGSAENDLSHLLESCAPVVALEVLARPDLAEAALAMGVAEIVAVEVTPGELLAVIKRAVDGKTVDMLEHRAALLAAVQESADLTDREVTILGLIGAGLSNQEIAQELYLSINSVKTYIRTAYRKIGVQKRPEAVLWAVHHGLAPTRR